MRKPQPPPSLADFWQLDDVQILQDTIDKLHRSDMAEFVRAVNEKYLHWDKLRFQKLPEGATPDLVWAAVQMSRRSQRQILPLSFLGKEKLSFVLPHKHLEWLHRIDKQAGGAIGIGSDRPLVDDDDRYLFNSLMEEAIASSQLEGASTTRKIAKEMLRANRKPRTKAEQMILNNYLAILEVRDLNKDDLTPELLCHLQSILTDKTLDSPDGAGRFRRPDEAVIVVDHATDEVLHDPPPADEVGWRIQQVCDFANTISNPFVHPVIKAAVLHFSIGFIHPFVDGNGRTARAIFYWYMLKRGYWLFEYMPISRVLVRSPVNYARSYLYTESDSGDVTYFIRYHLQAILDAMQSFHNYVLKEQRALKMATSLLQSYPGLNNRQRSLIHDALRHPNMKTTVRGHQGKYHVTYPTARADLLGLIENKLLRSDKIGKASFFYPVDDLKQRLCVSESDKEKIRSSVAITKIRDTDDMEDNQNNTADKQKELFD